MGVAYFIVAEREVEGLDTFVNGKALARCPYLGNLADEAGVRSLLDFFSMSEEDASAFLDDPDPEVAEPESVWEVFEPERWFDASEGLVTVRGLIAHLEAGPLELPDDPIPDEVAELLDDLGPTETWTPSQSEVLEDLREYEVVLEKLAAEGVRWHLAIDV